jgi:hypothetical protein
MKKVSALAVVILCLVVAGLGEEKNGVQRDKAVVASALAVNAECMQSLSNLTIKSAENITASSGAEYLAQVHATLSSIEAVCQDTSELLAQTVTTHEVALVKLAMLRRIAGVLDAEAKTLQIILHTAK